MAILASPDGNQRAERDEVQGGFWAKKTRNPPKVPMTKDRNIPPPKNRKTAQSMKEWPFYLRAEVVEILGLEENDTWTLVPWSLVPKGATMLRCRWVYDDKKSPDGNIIGAKARLTAMGNTQVHGISYFDTYASVSEIRTIRLCLAIVNSSKDHHCYHIDIQQAFIRAKVQEEIYMLQPEGHVKKGKERCVCRLNKGLYGICQAARGFQLFLRESLMKIGFKILPSDNATYSFQRNSAKGNREWLIIPSHVDDLLFCSNSLDLIEFVYDKLAAQMPLKNLGEVTCMLKTTVARDRSRGLTKISSEPYIVDLLENSV
jgi:hypothetical protein